MVLRLSVFWEVQPPHDFLEARIAPQRVEEGLLSYVGKPAPRALFERLLQPGECFLEPPQAEQHKGELERRDRLGPRQNRQLVEDRQSTFLASRLGVRVSEVALEARSGELHQLRVPMAASSYCSFPQYAIPENSSARGRFGTSSRTLRVCASAPS